MDDKLNWQRHIDSIETKLSVAGALFKFNKYLSLRVVVLVCCSIVHSHLQYEVINWEN